MSNGLFSFIGKLFGFDRDAQELANMRRSATSGNSYIQRERDEQHQREEYANNLAANIVDNDDYINDLRIGRSWILPQFIHYGTSNNKLFSKVQFYNNIKDITNRKHWDNITRNYHALSVLYTTDKKAYNERARWWTKDVALAIVRNDFEIRKRYAAEHNTNENEYEDYTKYEGMINAISLASNPQTLFNAINDYANSRCEISTPRQRDEEMPSPEYLNAFVGDGTYNAMLTMVKFLKLTYADDSGRMLSRDECIADIEQKAAMYAGDADKLLDYCINKFFASGILDIYKYLGHEFAGQNNEAYWEYTTSQYRNKR